MDIRINLKVIGCAVLLFSFLEPEYFVSINFIHIGFNIIRALALILGFIIILIKRQVLPITLIVILFYCIYGLSTILNNGELVGLLSDSILIIGFVMWVELLLKNFPIKTLQILNFIFTSLVYINIIFFFIFPEGYNNYYSSTGLLVTRYFLGVYNQFAAYLIPAVVISVIYSLVRYNKIIFSTKVLIISVLFTFVYFWSATSIIGISLIILYLIFIHKGLLHHFINYKTISIIFITLFIVIVFMNNLSIFSFIIEDILNKDLTLSTRTRIWDIAIEMISDSFLLGYGYLEGGRYIYLAQNIERNAHNMFLQIFLQAGLLGFSSFVLMIIILFKKVTKYKSNKIVKFILFSLFTSSVMMLSEVYSLRFLYLIILIGIYSPQIIKKPAEK